MRIRLLFATILLICLLFTSCTKKQTQPEETMVTVIQESGEDMLSSSETDVSATDITENSRPETEVLDTSDTDSPDSEVMSSENDEFLDDEEGVDITDEVIIEIEDNQGSGSL